jgi:hypothetical protein
MIVEKLPQPRRDNIDRRFCKACISAVFLAPFRIRLRFHVAMQHEPASGAA